MNYEKTEKRLKLLEYLYFGYAIVFTVCFAYLALYIMTAYDLPLMELVSRVLLVFSLAHLAIACCVLNEIVGLERCAVEIMRRLDER